MRVLSAGLEFAPDESMQRGDTSASQRFDFPPEVTLMSMTDAKSYIRYANSAFLKVSGFALNELQGRPHNVVRHPDMPKEAFADLWATIKRGEAWTALVKNLRADGIGHYWVRANVTPVRQGDAIVGYMSVRTRPSDDEVEQAAALYRRFREGRARGLAFHKGLIVRKGWLGWTRIGQVLPVRWRIRLALAGVALACLAPMAAGGPGLMVLPGLLTVGAACWWLERRIAGPLAHMLTQAKAVAAGQVGNDMYLNRTDEIGMALRAINQSGLNLRALVGDVAEQMYGMLQGNEQIAQGNRELVHHTEQTRSHLQETAVAAQQIAAVVEASTDTTRKARELTDQASQAVARGGDVIGAVVASLQDISHSNNQVASINNLIDSIAFQTNLLALNAAVEAAQAGPAGRGFAVVAAEIRNLAQRSAGAAQDVRRLIEASVGKSRSVALQAEEAGKAMAEIVDRVQSVNALIAELSSGAESQSVGVVQVSGAVAQVDAMTQENAELLGQVSEAVEVLLGRTRRLIDAIQAFDRGNTLGMDFARMSTASFVLEDDIAPPPQALALR